MSIWQTIKNAFIPWNLIRSENAEHDGVRTVDYGQLLIDGTTGDISDMARVIEHERPIAAAEPAAGADKLAPNDDHQTAPPRG